MGANKVSKFASVKVATQIALAFSNLQKWCKKQHKELKQYANCDSYLKYVFWNFKRIVSLHNLNRCFYPLDATDYLEYDHIQIYGAEFCHDAIVKSIACIHPMMHYLPKLNFANCNQLIKTMRYKLSAFIFDELGVQR